MWLWAAFILFIFFLVALDVGIFHRRTRTIAFKEALAKRSVDRRRASLQCPHLLLPMSIIGSGSISPGVSQTTHGCGFIPSQVSDRKIARLGNIFFIALIFSYFRIPSTYQHRGIVLGNRRRG